MVYFSMQYDMQRHDKYNTSRTKYNLVLQSKNRFAKLDFRLKIKSIGNHEGAVT